MSEKLKVLALAEMCNPDWASVPLVGWNYVAELSKHTDLTLVTSRNNYREIERVKPNFLRIYAGFRAVDWLFAKMVRYLFRGNYGSATLTFAKIPFYLLFEIHAALKLRSKIAASEFELIHRVTPVSPVVPSVIGLLAKFYKVPFVLGPINGGLSWPKGYPSVAEQEQEFLQSVREIYQYSPLTWMTRWSAARILVGSWFAWDDIPERYRQRCVYQPENGIDRSELIDQPRLRGAGPLRVVFVGRMVAIKCPDIVIEAMQPLLQAGQTTLDIIGDGPMRASLEALARRLAVPVHFHGWISDQKLVQRLLASFHVLAFPSIREFGGGVVVEAMAKGVVPIVMDYGGPSEIVTDQAGFRLPLSDRKQTVNDLRQRLQELVDKSELWQQQSQGACRRIEEQYTWQAKIKQTLDVYQDLKG